MYNFNRMLPLLSILLCTCCLALAQTVSKLPADPDPAYTQVIQGRAQKIVDGMQLTEPAQATRVRDLIADQYRSLSILQDTCDEKIKAIQQAYPEQPETAKAAIEAVKDLTQSLQDQLHVRYLLKLSSELTPEQIDQVKDGMTYGVVQFTYQSYLEMLPDLTEEQKAVIIANLVEAREIAMDAGSSKQKHAWFGKYKGRINNYLSAQGYDLKKASEERNARNKAQ